MNPIVDCRRGEDNSHFPEHLDLAVFRKMVLVLVYDNLGKDIRADMIAAYDRNRCGGLDDFRVGCVLVSLAAKDRALGDHIEAEVAAKWEVE